MEGLLKKLAVMAERFDEIETLIQDPAVISNTPQYTALLKEHGQLKKVTTSYKAYDAARRESEEAREMIEAEDDTELRAMAEEEAAEQAKLADELLAKIRSEFLDAQDEEGSRNVIVEIRAGAGGDEAALFAGDLFRMYSKYAEKHKWSIEIMETADAAGVDGYKAITFGVKGQDAYRHLRYESGGHRVQRVPETESQGRVHTSACTVAVLPEAEEVDIHISTEDLRIDTYRASGPGGQHVNKTASAIRITHLPTGTVAQCQDGKSQHKNKAKAMRMIRSRIYDEAKRRADKERGDMRRSQIGSGDRSERIRTYNFPQNRVSDHRANLTIYNLDKLIMGEMTDLIDQLQTWDKEQRLQEIDI